MTLEQVEAGAPVLYQPVLFGTASVGGLECEIVGIPDFLIKNNGEYIVRDSKISRRITEKDHPEILEQLGLYAWLYERNFGSAPSGVQVHSGSGEIVEVPYDGGVAALETLSEIVKSKRERIEPRDPVGWSRCTSCGYFDYCWKTAEEKRDVALVFGVDQGLARQLYADGIDTFDRLCSEFDGETLAEYQRPWGKGMRRVGKSAPRILTMAEALASNEEIPLAPLNLPEHSTWVMFDLEGLPPHLDELEKIYLWGLQVFGDNAGSYQSATAGFGPEGDREAWDEFLETANVVFQEHGDVPFVHWHHYEKTEINRYIERFGDTDGIGERVIKNLLDLRPLTREAVALPLPSYSLKVVEQYIGFERTQTEYGGDWAMAKYIEATETEDEALRAEVMDAILEYNREDLEATWAVLQWLQAKA